MTDFRGAREWSFFIPLLEMSRSGWEPTGAAAGGERQAAPTRAAPVLHVQASDGAPAA